VHSLQKNDTYLSSEQAKALEKVSVLEATLSIDRSHFLSEKERLLERVKLLEQSVTDARNAEAEADTRMQVAYDENSKTQSLLQKVNDEKDTLSRDHERQKTLINKISITKNDNIANIQQLEMKLHLEMTEKLKLKSNLEIETNKIIRLQETIEEKDKTRKEIDLRLTLSNEKYEESYHKYEKEKEEWSSEIIKLQDEANKAQRGEDTARKLLITVRKRLEDSEVRYTENIKQIDEKYIELMNERDAQNKEIQSQLEHINLIENKLKNSEQEKASKMKELQMKLDNTLYNVDVLEKSHETLKEMLNSNNLMYENQIGELERTIVEIKSSNVVNDLNKIIYEHEQTIDKLQSTLNEKDTVIQTMTNDHRRLEDRYDINVQSLTKYRNDLQNINTLYEKEKDSHLSFERNYNEKLSDYNNLSERLIIINNELDMKSKEIKQLNIHNSRYRINCIIMSLSD
jgi:chromosome segregation ATPase